MSHSIGIDEVLNGMVLAAPVKNKYGQVILSAGTVLEDKHGKIFRMWGIKELFIKAENDSGIKDEQAARRLSDAKEILSKRLKWNPKNKTEEELYELALQITLEKIY